MPNPQVSDRSWSFAVAHLAQAQIGGKEVKLALDEDVIWNGYATNNVHQVAMEKLHSQAFAILKHKKIQEQAFDNHIHNPDLLAKADKITSLDRQIHSLELGIKADIRNLDKVAGKKAWRSSTKAIHAQQITLLKDHIELQKQSIAALQALRSSSVEEFTDAFSAKPAPIAPEQEDAIERAIYDGNELGEVIESLIDAGEPSKIRAQIDDFFTILDEGQASYDTDSFLDEDELSNLDPTDSDVWSSGSPELVRDHADWLPSTDPSLSDFDIGSASTASFFSVDQVIDTGNTKESNRRSVASEGEVRPFVSNTISDAYY